MSLRGSTSLCARCLRAQAPNRLFIRHMSSRSRPSPPSTSHQVARSALLLQRSPLNALKRNAYSTETTSHSSNAPLTPPPIADQSTTTTVLNPQFSPDDNSPLAITITPRAASRLSTIMAKDSNPHLTLRITVESGGCHGFQYLMKLESTDKVSPEEDTLFVFGADGSSAKDLGRGRPKVVMDSASLDLLHGSKVDFTMELIGSQFKIVDNPRATSSCGCGTSFDVNM